MLVVFCEEVDSVPQFCYLACDRSGGDESWRYEILRHFTRRSPMSAEVEHERALVELDLRGNVCPGPTGDTLAALKELPPGGRLAVTSDYLPARQTIPRLVEQRGCSWQITDDDGKTFRLEIVKGEWIVEENGQRPSRYVATHGTDDPTLATPP